MSEATDHDRLTCIRRSGTSASRSIRSASSRGFRDCSAVGDMARGHLAAVRETLDGLKASLEAFVQQCDTACAGGSGRVVFENLRSAAGCC